MVLLLPTLGIQRNTCPLKNMQKKTSWVYGLENLCAQKNGEKKINNL